MVRAHVGDEIRLQPPGIEYPVREGEVLRTADDVGNPPYQVRWDDGRETLLFPGPDAIVRHLHGCAQWAEPVSAEPPASGTGASSAASQRKQARERAVAHVG